MKNTWFTVKNIRPQLYALAEFDHFEKVVSYLLVGKTRAVLFDTGIGHRSIHKVMKGITRLPTIVFLTHSHWDHVGGIYKNDHVYIFDDSFEKKELAKKRVRYETVKDHQVIQIDNYSIKVIHTPGHTPGSASYFIKDLNWLFVGDTLYPGPLYAHLPESNVRDYAKSLKKLSTIANRETLILPGHNGVTCDYQLLADAAILMNEIGNDEVKGKGFSIRI